MKQVDIKITHVPYKGSLPCTQDLIGGQVDVSRADVTSTIPFVKAGRVKALATSGPVQDWTAVIRSIGLSLD